MWLHHIRRVQRFRPGRWVIGISSIGHQWWVVLSHWEAKWTISNLIHLIAFSLTPFCAAILEPDLKWGIINGFTPLPFISSRLYRRNNYFTQVENLCSSCEINSMRLSSLSISCVLWTNINEMFSLMHTLTGFDYEFMQLKKTWGKFGNHPKTVFALENFRFLFLCEITLLSSFYWSDLNHKNMITPCQGQNNSPLRALRSNSSTLLFLRVCSCPDTDFWNNNLASRNNENEEHGL